MFYQKKFNNVKCLKNKMLSRHLYFFDKITHPDSLNLCQLDFFSRGSFRHLFAVLPKNKPVL